jgi:hypothetical protein
LAWWLLTCGYVFVVHMEKFEINAASTYTILPALEMYIKNDMKAKMRFLYDLEADVGKGLWILEMFRDCIHD